MKSIIILILVLLFILYLYREFKMRFGYEIDKDIKILEILIYLGVWPSIFENVLGISSERVKRNENAIENMESNQHQFVGVTKNKNGEEEILT